MISLRTFGLLTGLISALLSASASAATIDRFQADLQLLPDGDLLVVETLDVDFGPIFEALRDMQYQGYVSVEVFIFDPGPEAIAEKSLRYMKSFT